MFKKEYILSPQIASEAHYRLTRGDINLCWRRQVASVEAIILSLRFIIASVEANFLSLRFIIASYEVISKMIGGAILPQLRRYFQSEVSFRLFLGESSLWYRREPASIETIIQNRWVLI